MKNRLNTQLPQETHFSLKVSSKVKSLKTSVAGLVLTFFPQTLIFLCTNLKDETQGHCHLYIIDAGLSCGPGSENNRTNGNGEHG